jgi:16S rRNA C967 or C1407 C5-methylase (RsmB/RsmF family)
MNQPRIFYSASDCITRFNASKFPLKNVAADVIKSKNLNSRERKIFLDLVFSWSRNRHLVRAFFAKYVKLYYAMSEQEKELLGLSLVADVEFDFGTNKITPEFIEQYKSWLSSLGSERYFVALGPLVGERLRESYPDLWQDLVASLWASPAKYLAFDSRVVKEELIEVLKKAGVEIEPHSVLPSALKIKGDLVITKLPKKFADHVWFMDAGSQIIARLLRPKAGERVLDMCVGEGSKARLISEHDCEYFAVDIDARRLERAKKVLSSRVKFLCSDASALNLPRASFDWVLLDAPCSGSGVIRRNPDLIHRLDQNDLDKYLKLQKNLLKSALDMLKPGGIVIYATCSLFAVENQQQIASIVRETKNLIPVSLRELLADGAIKLDDLDLDKNSLTLLPHIHDCDAFYLAALRKS